jgi:hypothetical protein
LARGCFARTALLIVAGCSRSRPASTSRGPAAQSAIVRDSVTSSIELGGVQLYFDSTQTFAMVEARFGRTARTNGKDHDFDVLCYATDMSGVHADLFLRSNEMGGPERRILGYRITTRDTRASQPTGCTELRTDAVKTNNGLMLGMSERDLLMRTGWAAHADGKYNSTYRSGDTLFSSLDARVEGGTVVELAAWYGRVD